MPRSLNMREYRGYHVQGWLGRWMAWRPGHHAGKYDIEANTVDDLKKKIKADIKCRNKKIWR